MIRFQVRLSPGCFLESEPTDYLSREYYLKVGTHYWGCLRNLCQALPRIEKWSIIHFREEYTRSLVSPAFQGHRRLYSAISIQRILSLPLHPKHFLSTLGKLHVQLISYLVGSPGWSPHASLGSELIFESL